MDTQPEQLLPRDKLLRDSFTPAETLLFGLILITSNVVFWLAEPRSYWLLGFFLIAGAMTPVILKTHQDTHPFFVSFLWPKFWLCTAPAWLIMACFLLGLFQRPLTTVLLDDSIFFSLEIPEHIWLPVSTSAETAWPVVFGYSAIYIVSIGLFIVPKSRAFFERLMPCLCLSAAIVAILGYIQIGLNAKSPFLTKGTGAKDFFGWFPYDGHWAAFALLWCCACITMALLTTRYSDSPSFIQSTGPLYLTGGTILGVSAFFLEARWPSALLILTYATMMMLVTVHFSSNKNDPHHRTIVLLCGLCSTTMFGAGLHRIFSHTEIVQTGAELRRAAWEMFTDSPLFGWGLDSFGHLLPYFGSDLLVGKNYERVGSDVLQLLAEIGIACLAPVVVLLCVLVIRYLKGKTDIQLTNHLFIGLSAVMGLAFLDTPFMSPAVFYSFVVLLFIGLRWADISRNRADEVDAPRPQLVTPESQRRAPFYTKPMKDKLR